MSTATVSAPLAPAPMIQVMPLPAVLSGIAEAQVYLRLPDDFVRTWLEIGGEVPAIPHFRVGQRICFPTEAVLAWLEKYHGCGGETMRHPDCRPKTKRKQPGT